MEHQLFVVLQNLTWKCCGSHKRYSVVLPKNLSYGTLLLNSHHGNMDMNHGGTLCKVIALCTYADLPISPLM